MDRVFFDTNVVLDVLERRSPWFPESAECLAIARHRKCRGALSALSLSDIAYIQKRTPPGKLVESFRLLRGFLEIAALDTVAVDGALSSPLGDFEDGLQLNAAVGWRATHLLTRNLKDFPRCEFVVIQTPADYLHMRRGRGGGS